MDFIRDIVAVVFRAPFRELAISRQCRRGFDGLQWMSAGLGIIDGLQLPRAKPETHEFWNLNQRLTLSRVAGTAESMTLFSISFAKAERRSAPC